MRRTSRVIAAAVAAAVVAGGGGYLLVRDHDAAFPLRRLVIATGGTGGVYYQLGTALAAEARVRWRIPVEVKVTAASVENLRLVANGQADVAFTVIDAADAATSGRSRAATPTPAIVSEPPAGAGGGDGAGAGDGGVPIQALAGLYDDYLQIVVRGDVNIRKASDLRGYRVSTGAVDSGTDLLSSRLIRLMGMDPERDVVRQRLGVNDSVAALRAGRLDAFFFTGGLPTPAIAALFREMPVRLVPVGEYGEELRKQYGDFYLDRSIPESMYGIGQITPTIGIPNILVARADMPQDVAYALTALLFEAKPRLIAAHPEARRITRRSAVVTYPLPLHPGAARYYREAKQAALGPDPGRAPDRRPLTDTTWSAVPPVSGRREG